MPIYSEDYIASRNRLVSVPITENQLSELISEFQSEINSRRRSSYINSPEELIKVLEKRGFLESNFRDFVQRFTVKVGRRDIYQDMMTRYQPRNAGQRLFSGVSNFESSGLPRYSYGSVQSGSGSSDTAVQEPTNVLPFAAIDRIVRDIGTNWKDLARELSIREGDIDDIECKYARQLKEKARACLKIFLAEMDPYKVQPILLDALDKCGRRDLRESVQEIFTRKPY